MTRLTLFTLFLAAGITAGAQQARDLLMRTAKALEAKQYMSYNLTAKYKGAKEKDTLITHFVVTLAKQSKDSLLGGLAWVDMDTVHIAEPDGYPGRRRLFYDGKRLYHVYRRAKLLIIDTEQIKLFRAFPSFAGNAIWQPFLKPSLITESANRPGLVRHRDTTVNGIACYHIYIPEQDIYPYKPAETWLVARSDLIPIYRRIWTKDGDKYSYTELAFDDHNFKDVSRMMFSLKQVPADYARSFR